MPFPFDCAAGLEFFTLAVLGMGKLERTFVPGARGLRAQTSDCTTCGTKASKRTAPVRAHSAHVAPQRGETARPAGVASGATGESVLARDP